MRALGALLVTAGVLGMIAFFALLVQDLFGGRMVHPIDLSGKLVGLIVSVGVFAVGSFFLLIADLQADNGGWGKKK